MKVKSAVILTGGHGTRLQPLTNVISKHLITVKDKFLIDYPIEILKKSGVEDLTVILGSEYFEQIVKYLKDGQDFGLNIKYVYQRKADGIASAINLAKDCIKDDRFIVCLGDNLFLSNENILSFLSDRSFGADIVLTSPPDIHRFGCASIDKNNNIVKIEEKPKTINNNFQNYAISGLYVFDKNYFEYFKDLKPSHRGEWEIVDMIKKYHSLNQLNYTHFNGQWLDVGTKEALNKLNDIIK